MPAANDVLTKCRMKQSTAAKLVKKDGRDMPDMPGHDNEEVGSAGLSSRLAVDVGFGNFGQKLIGLFLFLERLIQNRLGIGKAEFPGPGNEGPIAGNLIMLDCLGSGTNCPPCQVPRGP